ncbi:TatD family hydrolase [Rhizosphaericola mali]|uniref:TatD family deoxyribonuclease n=1 Tax=Rhizosphaericola mali TaxID=2545455 RepID=A0A5P2FZU0_9BACT|nr:TatD family hydrolase [Rhizosphaericola mali]QES87928.1 TatD family deoxyribonuclease [Rhizosphaericola mali]
MKYYDCHTYLDMQIEDVVAIRNVQISEDSALGKYQSIGIHPWNVQADFETELAILEEKITSDAIIAVGECGLDRLHFETFELQKKVFQQQITFANKYQKPLIVHCVKAFSECLQLLSLAKVPVIIHGVNNKWDSIAAFVDRGYFLSFGAAILKVNSISRKILPQIPIHQLLLETDDTDISIQSIYQTAASLLTIDSEAFNLQIESNFHKIFQI